jgi:hypothetical protein
MHLDSAIPATLWTYWRRSFEPVNLRYMTPFKPVVGTVEMAAATAAMLGLAIYQAWRRQWLALVLLAWFLITLGPVIPLRNHITDYYLTLPVMCLAMLGAWSLVCAWHASVAWKAVGAVVAGGFLVLNLPVAWRTADWWRKRSEAQEALVMGVARARALHPDKVILLDGVSDELFWGAISQRPFLFLRISDVYLTPGSEARITPHPELDDVAKFVLPTEDVRRGLDRGTVVVYRAGSGPLRNITHRYTVPAEAGDSGTTRVDMSDPLADEHLGPTWYARESGYRWMPATATVRMAGPRTEAAKLYVTAICPQEQLAKEPLEMQLTIDEIALPTVKFTKGNVETTFSFPLPPKIVGKSNIEITVRVSRTVLVRGDRRELGLVFGRFEIK